VPDLPILDPQQIQMLIDLDPEGAPALIAELVQILEEDAPKRLAELAEALARGSAEDASGAAHALKGGVSNLGLLRLAAVAKEAEKLGREKNVAAIQPLVPRLQEEFQAALAELKRTYLKG
jgi:HPt (histidine-containing phosphotransfer) domain-containing protein